MPIPLSTEKVARAVIKALVRGNFLSDSAQAEKLFAVPANATESQIDTIVNGLTYSTPGVGGTDFVSDGDINMWVDADNLPAIAHSDYFRIARNGSSAVDLSPATSAAVREMMTVGRLASMLSQTNTVEMVLGPRRTLLGAPASYGAQISVGPWHDGANSHYYGTFLGSALALANSTIPGLLIEGLPAVEIRTSTSFSVSSSVSPASIRGGFHNPGVGSTFFVGPYVGGVAANALLLQYNVATTDFEMKMARNTNDRTLYLNNNETNGYKVNVCVGGWPGVVGRETSSGFMGYPSFSVYGPLIEAGGSSVALFRSFDATGAYTGKVVRVLADDGNVAEAYNLLTCEQRIAAVYVNRFTVKNNGNVYADGAYASPAADLAEWMDASEQFDPGTVLVVRAGKLRPTQQIAETGVIGVVSTKPGVVLNAQEKATQTRVLVARSGIVPVKCSTLCGVIRGDGEVLVAGPDGCAVLAATSHPAYGTIVGKALEALGGGISPPTVGMINVLVGA
jgi:hypothetical protein